MEQRPSRMVRVLCTEQGIHDLRESTLPSHANTIVLEANIAESASALPGSRILTGRFADLRHCAVTWLSRENCSLLPTFLHSLTLDL
jgi:hypothetical protein